MGTLLKFNANDVPAAQRARYWSEVADSAFHGTYVNLPGEDFRGSMLTWKVGNLSMIRTTTSSSVVGRIPLNVDEDRLILHLQCRGASEHEQNRMECELRPGDFVLATPHMPYNIRLAGNEMFVVEFPRAPLAERFSKIDDAIMQRMCGASPGGRMFHDFLLSLWQQGEGAAADPDWEVGVNEIFYDLAALAMRGASKPTPFGSEAELRKKVLAAIESHLNDPDLRTASIANMCGISSRTVQVIFAGLGTTPTMFILDRRLRRAADRLATRPDESITDVAFSVGFNDSAYFSRCFKQHFGVSPRQWPPGQTGPA